MQKEHNHRGFIVTWQEPPHTTEGFVFNIGSNDRRLAALIHAATGKWTHVSISAARDNGLADTKAWIDRLVDHS